MSRKNDYIDNEEFTKEVIKYAEACKKAELAGKSKPKMSNYIGESIYKIANGLANKPNFRNYTYLDEMVSDGIENVCKYLSNFDAEKMEKKGKKPNAFAYVTQIIYYAFLRRLEKEKTQSEIKNKSLEHSGLFEEIAATQSQDGTNYYNNYMHNILNNPEYNPKEED